MTESIGPTTAGEDGVEKLWASVSKPASIATWLAVDSVRQLDEGELGRGSSLCARRAGKSREYQVTYWEPRRALGLKYQGRFLQTAYRFSLEPEEDPVRIRVQLVNQSEGLWHWLNALIIGRERRRIDRLTVVPTAGKPADTAQP